MNKVAPNDEHNQEYMEAIRQARIAGMHSFQSWFNKAESVEQAIIRGYWDFGLHILTRKVCELVEEPEQKTALEIGYGGGRLLNAACSYFKKAIGIDIHDEQETVAAFLRDQGKNNFKLLKTSGMAIDVEPESIDLIYSFIVLQHLPSFDTFCGYITETHRCLEPGGVAQLYFGKFGRKMIVRYPRDFVQGCKEILDAPVNYTSLVIRISKVRKICEDTGFRVIETGSSYKRVPDGYPKIKGGQNYITLLK